MRRPEDTETAAELVALMQKQYPHFKFRLGREGDPELSEMLISFAPRSSKSKGNMQPKKTSSTCPLTKIDGHKSRGES